MDINALFLGLVGRVAGRARVPITALRRADAIPAAHLSAKPSTNIASLDGLRAIAITLVFLAHGGLSEIVPGGLGVTMFFVLSGFLITTLMRIEYAATGKLDLPAFYSRRLLRLMPPLLIIVLFTLLLDEAVGSHSPPTLGGIASVIFYVSNYFSIYTGYGIPDGLGVTWSLAVEEHFYIVFPIAALLLLRVNRTVSAASLGLVCLAILAWRCWLIAHGAPSGRVYMGTDTRVDAILVGCAMALLANPVLDPVLDGMHRRAIPIVVACLGILAGTLIYRSESFRYTFRFTIQSLAIAPIIYCVVCQSSHRAFRWLNSDPLTYLGRISYTVYLAHATCLVFVAQQWPDLGMVGTMMVTALLVAAIAVPMRLWVEIPFAGIRKRLHERRMNPVSSVIGSALVK